MSICGFHHETSSLIPLVYSLATCFRQCPADFGLCGSETKSNWEELFQDFCRDCHGPQGYGRGSLSTFLEQEPANLFSQVTQSKTDQELFLIIKNGGGLDMHGWADTFTDQQIGDLVQFIRSLP